MALSFDSYKSLVTKIAVRELAIQWARNGHKLTNKLIDDIKVEVKQLADSVVIEVWMYGYGGIQDTGVSAGNIPFSGTGGGGKSAYIEGLVKYVEMRMGLSDKEALGVAFAIAYKQKQSGMPIKRKGRGSGWIDKSGDKMLNELSNITARYTGQVIDLAFEKIMKI
jgi:hypothetical protein